MKRNPQYKKLNMLHIRQQTKKLHMTSERPNGSPLVYLSKEYIRDFGWWKGTPIKIFYDVDNKRIIIEEGSPPSDPQTPSTQGGDPATGGDPVV